MCEPPMKKCAIDQAQVPGYRPPRHAIGRVNSGATARHSPDDESLVDLIGDTTRGNLATTSSEACQWPHQRGFKRYEATAGRIRVSIAKITAW